MYITIVVVKFALFSNFHPWKCLASDRERHWPIQIHITPLVLTQLEGSSLCLSVGLRVSLSRTFHLCYCVSLSITVELNDPMRSMRQRRRAKLSAGPEYVMFLWADKASQHHTGPADSQLNHRTAYRPVTLANFVNHVQHVLKGN